VILGVDADLGYADAAHQRRVDLWVVFQPILLLWTGALQFSLIFGELGPLGIGGIIKAALEHGAFISDLSILAA